jgi:hypothetical protein
MRSVLTTSSVRTLSTCLLLFLLFGIMAACGTAPSDIQHSQKIELSNQEHQATQVALNVSLRQLMALRATANAVYGRAYRALRSLPPSVGGASRWRSARVECRRAASSLQRLIPRFSAVVVPHELVKPYRAYRLVWRIDESNLLDIARHLRGGGVFEVGTLPATGDALAIDMYKSSLIQFATQNHLRLPAWVTD